MELKKEKWMDKKKGKMMVRSMECGRGMKMVM